MTTRDDQLSGWTEKKLQSTKFAPKKGHCHWWPAAHPNHHSFLNPGKTITSESMLGKPMRCTEKCNACSWHWSTERAQFFSTTTPDCMSHNQHFKTWMNWATKFCLIHHTHLTSCQPITRSSSILTTFCRENTSITIRRQKMLSKSLLNPKVWIFMLQE